jgi:ParB family transcriptional regulator, chromosome partitioning protein
MPSPSKPFSTRARAADLAGGSVFALRTEAALNVATPVPLEAIVPNPRNPRRAVARDEAFQELVESIRQHGLVQPIVVRREGVRRVLIVGHRRLAAIQQLAAEAPGDPRWRKVLAIERTADEDQAFLLALVENLHREDLSPQDEAAALDALEHQLGSAQAVASAIGRSEAYVSKRKRVYQDPVLAPAVLEQGLPVSTAEELLGARDADVRRGLAERAVSERWKRPTARAAVRSTFAAKPAPEPACEPPDGFAAKPAAPMIDTARSRAVLGSVQVLRQLLEAGPLTSLSAETAHELRAFARYLNDELRARGLGRAVARSAGAPARRARTAARTRI